MTCPLCRKVVDDDNPVDIDSSVNVSGSVSTERYFLKTPWTKWVEVTKAVWVKAERAAGFRNTMGYPYEPATGGFSRNGVEGRIIDAKSTADGYAWDKGFVAVAWPES